MKINSKEAFDYSPRMRQFMRSVAFGFLIAAGSTSVATDGPKPPPNGPLAIEIRDGIKVQCVLVKPGKFTMGSPTTESGRSADEKQHEVTISKAYYIGIYTVTQEQYEKLIGTNPSKFKGPKNPVENVSWNDAQEFCKRISAVTGKAFRLPTEAEWEYACRAGTTTAYCFGDDVSGLGEYAWNGTTRTTDPVGTKKPNAWGLYDMHRNVYEWCQDKYGDYPTTAVTDPKGPEQGNECVMRGGCWVTSPVDCRSAHRLKVSPSIAGVEFLGMSFGFRVVVDGNN